MNTFIKMAGAITLTATLTGSQASVLARQSQVTPAGQPGQTGGTDAGPAVRRLSLDDAVQLALEQNINLQVERINPQIQDEQVAFAATVFRPTWTSDLSYNGTTSPPDSFLSGSEGGGALETGVFRTSTGLRQQIPIGGLSYTAGWDGSRSTTNSLFSNFNPRVNSTLAFSVVQPLMRNRRVDAARTQLVISRRNREISAVTLRGQAVDTVRAVKNAYWDLKYALANLEVHRQSLQLAEQTLRDNRTRVQVGTMAPIDIVEAEAEVARNEESVIVAEAAIEQAEDDLRAMLLDPGAPEFWTVKLDPTDAPRTDPIVVDVEGAIRAARDTRADLLRAQHGLANIADNLRLYRDQTLPEVNAQVDYSLAGLGGRQFLRGEGFPGPVVGTLSRGLGSVLGDVLSADFPAWTIGFTVSYPVGRSAADANLTRTGLERRQALLQIEQIYTQMATQIRGVGRQVTTNMKRIEATRAARLLAERRLDAEQRKFGVGTSTSFLVFQAQRELATSRVNELKALLDYNKSLADFEAVQETPLSGTGIIITGSSANATGQAASTSAGTGSSTSAGGQTR